MRISVNSSAGYRFPFYPRHSSHRHQLVLVLKSAHIYSAASSSSFPSPISTMSTNADHEDPIADFHVSRIPYNEDTIVKIINETYHLYQQLNYIAIWELIWPPEGGHVINQALCEELHLDPAVISLMKRLPYIRWSQLASDIPFMRFSRPFVYLEDDEIRGGRDPDRFQVDEPRINFLLPHEIALTCSTDEGSSAIMDLKESEYRPVYYVFMIPSH